MCEKSPFVPSVGVVFMNKTSIPWVHYLTIQIHYWKMNFFGYKNDFNFFFFFLFVLGGFVVVI
jgi:hypothetical protein